LEPVTIAEIGRERPVAADMLLGRGRVRNAQVIKQADVLMAHHLVPDECEPGSLEPNLTYYEPRTSHGSSLSPGVHAALLARAARFDEALHWLRVAADVDLADVTNTTAGGLHLATMGSVWQAFAWGFGGIRPRANSLVVDPRLPEELEALELSVRFHGVPVRVRIEPDETMVVSEQPIRIRLGSDGPARECGPHSVTFRNR
jgi:trehalose/maltose hydrolase-like predicted phosphorylase